MFNITGIDHIVLKTSHLANMLHFYVDILGCQVEKVQEASHLTQLRAGNCLIDIIEDNHYVATTHNLDHYCLRITPFNYDALFTYFKDNQVEVSSYAQRYGAEGNGYSFLVYDPEGNKIELKATK